MLSHLARSIACFCPVLPFITISRSEEKKNPRVFHILRNGGGDDRLRSLRLLPTHHAGHCGLSPDGAFGRKGCPGPVPCFSSPMSSVSPVKTNNSCTNRSLYWSGVPRAASCSDINGPMSPMVCKFRWKHCRPYAYKTGTIRECV